MVAELRNITIWRQSHLLYCRNEFLEKVQNEVDEKRISKKLEQSFNKLANNYSKNYRELWINNLMGLKRRCDQDKDLKTIKGEVEKLLEDGIKQLKLLEDLSIKKDTRKLQQSFQSTEVDKCFVLPVLGYKNAIEQILSSYSYCESWYASSNIPHFTDIFRSHVKKEVNKEFDIKNYIRQCSFAKLQELCKVENIQNSSEIMNFISQRSSHYCTQHAQKPATEEEIKQVVLVQVLDEYIDRLKEEFKKEKT